MKREAASRGETVTVDEYSDPTDGTPSTYLSFPHFTLSLPQGESCRVSGRLAFYRDEPLDLDAAVAWLAERAARYDPPAFIVVRNFHVDNPVTVALRWVDPMNRRWSSRCARPTARTDDLPAASPPPATARSVYVNGGASREELLVYAHALLAILMG